MQLRLLGYVFFYASAAMLTACERSPAQTAPVGQGAQISEASASTAAGMLLPQCGSLISSLDHQQYKFQQGIGFFISYREPRSGVERTCITESFGFNRFLLPTGEWLNRSELEAVQRASGASDLDGFQVHVLGVSAHRFPPAVTELSAIGRPQVFDGVPFTKWTATASEIEAFNKANPLRNTTSSPSWSINGTKDSRTGQPIHLSCLEPVGVPSKGDDVYLAAATNTDSKKSGARDAWCTIWFAFEIDGIGHVRVKVMGFDPRHSQTIVKNVTEELGRRIQRY